MRPGEVYNSLSPGEATKMTKTLHARYDGEALHPEESLPIAPETRILITVDTEDDEQEPAPVKGEPYSFLRYAESLSLEGPEDWSERLEDYLYAPRETPK
jgi:hypothetical protein